MVTQHKTLRPVQFEITPATSDALQAWVKLAGLKGAHREAEHGFGLSSMRMASERR